MESTPVPPPLPVTVPGNTRRPCCHRAGTALALVAIAACVILIVQGEAGSGAKREKQEVTPNVPLNMVARYGHGVKVLTSRINQWDEEGVAAIERALEPMAREPVDRFRVELVLGFMNDRSPDPEVLQQIEATAPSLSHDMEVLAEIHQKGRGVSPSDWDWFRARHGWIARATRAQALPKSDPEWQALAADGTRTMFAMVLAMIAILASLAGGVALLVIAVVRWRRGKLPVAIERLPAAWGGVLLEGFAIYLCGWSLVPATLHYFMPEYSRWAFLGFATLVVPVAMLWPRWRGLDRQTWKQALGLHMGKGFWKEAGAGFLGWVAATPIIALGLFAAQWIAKATDAEMSHPIVDPLTTPGASQIAAVLLAVMWAPLAEEAMFRGLLFPGLSALWRWMAGALAGAFIFAVVHPQGLAAVPAIMAIAFAASMVRLVRGSLIAPIALHVCNNGTLVVLLILSMG